MENLLIDGLSKLNQLKENIGSKTDGKKVQDDYLMHKKDPDRKLADNGPSKDKSKSKSKSKKPSPINEEDDDSDSGFGSSKKRIQRKKPVDYQYVVTQKNQIDSRKFFGNPSQLGDYITGDDRALFQSENFQAKFVREYPRILWDTEKLEDIGEYVLLFPNPDAMPSAGDGEGIRLSVAKEYFNNIIDSGYKFQGKFKRALNEAFVDAFIELDEIIPPKNSKDKGTKPPQPAPNTGENSKPKPAEKSSFCGRKQKSAAPTTDPKAANPLNTEAAQLVSQDKPLDPAAAGLPGETSPSKAKKKKAGDGGATPGKTPKAADDQKKTDGGQPTKQTGNPKADENDTSEQDKAKLRRVWNGAMYRPPDAHKGAKADKTHESAQWIRDDGQTRDLHTLMRRCVLTALAHSGFITREVFVENGEWIAVVITMPEDSLKVVAQEMGLFKPVDLGLSDIASFEPIDNRNRPLRLHHHLRSENAWKAAYFGILTSKKQKERILKLRDDINELLEYECNFKKLYRMSGCGWTEEETDDYNSSNIEKHAKISLQTWLDYRDFLTQLSLHLKEIELLKEKLLHMLNTYYNTDRIAVQKNVPKSRLVRQDIYKIINHMIVNAFKDCLKDYPSLDTFWTAIDKKPTEYIYQYQHSHNKMRPRNREALERLWSQDMFTFPHNKKHFTDEAAKLVSQRTPFQKLREFMVQQPDKAPNMFEILYESEQLEVYSSLFTKVERLKILDYAINKVIDINQLSIFYADMKKLQGGLISGLSLAASLIDDKLILFPLHDRRLTEGLNYSNYFAKLKHLKKLYDTMLTTKLQIKMQYASKIPVSKSAKPGQNSSLAGSVRPLQSNLTSTKMDGPKLEPKQAPIILADPNDEPVSPKSDNKGELDIPQLSMGFADQQQVPQEPRQGGGTDRSANQVIFNSTLQPSRRLRGFDDTSAQAIMKSRDRLVAFFKSLNQFSRFEGWYLWEIIHGDDPEPVSEDEDQPLPAQEGPHKSTTAAPPHNNKQSTGGAIMDKFGTFLKSKTERKRKQKIPEGVKMESAHEAFAKRQRFRDLAKELATKYRISDERLVDAVLQSFMTSMELTNVLLPEFNLLGIETFQSERAQSLEYPLEDSFVKSVTMTPASNSENTIVSYFGEKIGLYFVFVQHFQASTWRISIEGFFITLFDMLYLGFGNPDESLYTLSRANDRLDYFLKLLYIILKAYFALRATTWGTRFLKRWEQTESEFITRNGGSSAGELQIRPKFRGTWRRNIITDQMDEYFESSTTARLKQAVIYVFLTLSIVATLVSSFVILFIKRNWCKNHILDKAILGKSAGFNYMDQLVWNLAEMARAIGFNLVFVWIAKRLVNWRNHKYKEHHQADLIFLLSTFTLVNNSTIGLIIGFDVIYRTSYRIDRTTGVETFYFEPDFDCVFPSCATEFSVYLILSKAVQIIYEVVVELILYRVAEYLGGKASTVYKEIIGSCCSKKAPAKPLKPPKRTGSKKKTAIPSNQELPAIKAAETHLDAKAHQAHEDDEQSKLSKHSLQSQSNTFHKMTDDQELIESLTNTNLKPYQVVKEVNKSILRRSTADPEHYYKNINQEIHEQTKLRDGDSSGDVDPTLEPYLSLVSSVFFCCCFGVVMPFNFAASFAVCAVERYLVSNKLARKEKRAVPENGAPLELWKDFIQAVVYLSCISSSFYVAFVVLIIDGTTAQFVVFMGLLAGTIVFSNLFSSSLPSVTESTKTLADRMKFVKDYTIPSKPTEHAVKNTQYLKDVAVNLRLFGEYSAPAGTVDVFEAAKAVDEVIEQQQKEETEKLDRKKVAESHLK